MGLTHSFQNGIAVINADGSFGVEDVKAVFREVVEQYEASPRLRILTEDLGSTFNPDEPGVREFVAHWVELNERKPIAIALVVKRELHFGLGRMAMSLSEPSTLLFQVFRSRGEALDWLGENES